MEDANGVNPWRMQMVQTHGGCKWFKTHKGKTGQSHWSLGSRTIPKPRPAIALQMVRTDPHSTNMCTALLLTSSSCTAQCSTLSVVSWYTSIPPTATQRLPQRQTVYRAGLLHAPSYMLPTCHNTCQPTCCCTYHHACCPTCCPYVAAVLDCPMALH